MKFRTEEEDEGEEEEEEEEKKEEEKEEEKEEDEGWQEIGNVGIKLHRNKLCFRIKGVNFIVL